MQIEKAPANQENICISLTADAANAHNITKKKKRAANRKKHLQIKKTTFVNNACVVSI